MPKNDWSETKTIHTHSIFFVKKNFEIFWIFPKKLGEEGILE